MQSRNRLLAIICMSIALGIVVAGPAAAASRPPVPLAPTSAVSVTETLRGLGGFAVAASPIVCTPTMQLPHRSSHVPSNVNWIVNISCTAPVASLSATLKLLWVGHQWYGPVTNGNAGQSSLTSQIDAPCNTGDYQGVAHWAVLFYSGGSGTSYGATQVVHIDCA
jgi:hypothetical protein